ncbi:MAG TPA: transglutaminase-like cysteine peptidase [Rhizobiaceae bacterium]|nr:transglutaminase-like cysteine peptidase [Rhizobiaceae bacterium]
MFSNSHSRIRQVGVAAILVASTLFQSVSAIAGSSAYLAVPGAAAPAPAKLRSWQVPSTSIDAVGPLTPLAIAAGGALNPTALAGMAAVKPAIVANLIPQSSLRSPGLASKTPDVFGSKAIAFRKLPALEKLRSSYGPDGRDGLLDCVARKCSEAELRLTAELREVVDASPTEKASTVNAAVNRLVSYRRDVDQYRSLDHWATPLETLSRQAGDCEDYAILKMALLEELGIPASGMSVVVLKDERRNLFHAILALRIGHEYLVLDNMRDQVLRDSDLPHYAPFYSLNDGQAFIHGRKIAAGKMVASVDLRAIAPGEGPVDGADRAE